MPGGSFRIDPVPGLEHGELVYTGPNVMLGYAESPADLAAGRTITELRTGDLARKHPAGVYEVVGRRSRFVKIVGLRVDLGQVERILADLGVQAASAGTDDGLVVAVEGDHDTQLLGKVLAQGMGLPRAALELHAVEHLPRLATGKLDYPAVLALSGARGRNGPGGPPPGPYGCRRTAGTAAPGRTASGGSSRTPWSVADDRGRRHFRLAGRGLTVLRGGVRQAGTGLGPPPAGLARDSGPGPGTAAADCAGRKRRRFFAPLETSIVLRAVGIVLIVSTHVGLFSWQGTAHVLMAVAGYNFARFQLSGERLPAAAAAAGQRGQGWWCRAWRSSRSPTWSPTDTRLANILLLNAVIGPEAVTTQWHFWFIEVLVYLLVAMTACSPFPWADRAERRFPLLFPLALTGVRAAHPL